MGDSFWTYGAGPNRTAMDTARRYSFAQGLSERRVAVDELFAEETLDAFVEYGQCLWNRLQSSGGLRSTWGIMATETVGR